MIVAVTNFCRYVSSRSFVAWMLKQRVLSTLSKHVMIGMHTFDPQLVIGRQERSNDYLLFFTSSATSQKQGRRVDGK